MKPTKPPRSPPRRARDTVQREHFEDLVDPEHRALVKAKEFSFESRSFRPEDVEVVLFDIHSLDSFVACCAARAALGQRVQYEGVTRSGSIDLLQTELEDKVVAMVGLCWDYEDMRIMADSNTKILVIQSEETLTAEERTELESYGIWIEVDSRLGAGVLAWEFFNKGKPVPLLLRAIEDLHMGRGVFKNGQAMEDGLDGLLEDVDVTVAIKELLRPVAPKDELFCKMQELLSDNAQTRQRLKAIEQQGRQKEGDISTDQSEAKRQSVVRIFKNFPAWKCNVVLMSSKFEGRVADALAADLAAHCGAARCLGAVMEITERGVRVVLRSRHEGPDVSEIARHFGGTGSHTRAFFKAPSSMFLESYLEQPEVILREVCESSSVDAQSGCLALHPGDLVTVLRRGERFKESPLDDWSWGFKVTEPEKEGWFPTLSYSVYIALRAEESHAPGVEAVKEGDILVAYIRKGRYVYGARLPREPVTSLEKSWFPFDFDGIFQRLHSSSVRVLLEEAGFFERPQIFA